jgi:hypothetical protein
MPGTIDNVGAAAAPENFNDVLHDWMERAPWLALSVVAHALVILILIAIPWDELQDKRPAIVLHVANLPDPELFEDPPPEEAPEILEEPEVLDPTLVDVNLPPELPNELADELDVAEGDPQDLARAPFEGAFANDVIGISGGAGGGKYGQRFGKGPGRGKAGGGGGTEPTLRDALEWLVRHQSSDGSWDCDGFDTNCGKLAPNVCDGKGESTHDVGVTASRCSLSSATQHDARGAVQGTGRAWAQLAEAAAGSRHGPDRREARPRVPLQPRDRHARAVRGLPLLEVASAQAPRAGCGQLPLDRAQSLRCVALRRAALGRQRHVGHRLVRLRAQERRRGRAQDRPGSLPRRRVVDRRSHRPRHRPLRLRLDRQRKLAITRVSDRFPTDRGEAMTAVALLGRGVLGQDPDDAPVMARHAELLRARPPVWEPESGGVDLYYWYYASYAMYQMGGSRYWEPWNRAMKAAVVDSQRKDGDERGSWDPQVDPWGFSGGRVYSTALMALCLEVYFRYSRLAR